MLDVKAGGREKSAALVSSQGGEADQTDGRFSFCSVSFQKCLLVCLQAVMLFLSLNWMYPVTL